MPIWTDLRPALQNRPASGRSCPTGTRCAGRSRSRPRTRYDAAGVRTFGIALANGGPTYFEIAAAFGVASPSKGNMNTPTNSRDLVRELARQVMEIAALPVHDEKRAMWRKLNRLEPVRPMVWMDEMPWGELAGEELDCRCEDDLCRAIEKDLRRTIYCWNHLRTDMVVDPVYHVHRVWHDTGYGIEVNRHGHGDGDFGRGACDYVPAIKTEADIEKIQMPEITADEDATERNYERVCALIGDILPVEIQGIARMPCAPWDVLIQWWGIEELYTDMSDRPAFVHLGIGRMMDALLARLDQLEAQGLLSVGNGNHRVGSGGLGITDELPQPDYDGGPARTMDMWGTSTGQIFSEVSPAMHDEFCLQYELRWLERFGLNCYGCCEPLERKVGILRQIPRLRRISMSTWVDIDKAAAEVGDDFVFSSKPNPAIFAWNEWDAGQARKNLRGVLDRVGGLHTELIMKDITTCRHEPHRLREWCELAIETAEEYA